MQSFIILLKIDEKNIEELKGKRIVVAIKELHAASGCHIYNVKNPAKLDEWERTLKQANRL